MPADQMKKDYKGAASHLDYQQEVKGTSTLGDRNMLQNGMPLHQAAKEMRQQLDSLHNISLSLNACKTNLLKAYDNDGVAVSPQKPGGVYIPSHIERMVAESVRYLRSKEFPVFPEDIRIWVYEEVRGTPYELNFPDGKATEGWYMGFPSPPGLPYWSHPAIGVDTSGVVH